MPDLFFYRDPEEVEKMEVDEKEEAKEDVPQVAVVADKKPVPVDLPEEELKKLAGKTVKKGEDEYVIVVQGVDSGLCGKYWGDLDNLPRRRRRTAGGGVLAALARQTFQGPQRKLRERRQ